MAVKFSQNELNKCGISLIFVMLFYSLRTKDVYRNQPVKVSAQFVAMFLT